MQIQVEKDMKTTKKQGKMFFGTAKHIEKSISEYKK